ncbi:MAG: response regulator [Sandaracinaceae bacterium]
MKKGDAKVRVSTSRLRLGGGMWGRLARRALRRRTDARTTNRLLLEAMTEAGVDAVPGDRVGFGVFVCGPLADVVHAHLGPAVAEEIVEELGELFRGSDAFESDIQRRRPVPRASLTVVFVTTSAERGERLQRAVDQRADVVVVADIFALLQTAEARAPAALAVVADRGIVGLTAAALNTLQRVLPGGTRLVLWGGALPGTGRAKTSLEVIGLPGDAAPEQVAQEAVGGRAVTEDKGAPILLADDDELWRATLARRLNLEGFDVVAAPDGFSALEACIDHTPGLVLTDLEMPLLDGGQLASLLRTRLGDGAPPVLMLTAGAVPAGSYPGVAATLPKSVAFDVLLERIHALLDPTR